MTTYSGIVIGGKSSGQYRSCETTMMRLPVLEPLPYDAGPSLSMELASYSVETYNGYAE